MFQNTKLKLLVVIDKEKKDCSAQIITGIHHAILYNRFRSFKKPKDINFKMYLVIRSNKHTCSLRKRDCIKMFLQPWYKHIFFLNP